MERISQWYSKLRIWAPIFLAISGITLLLEIAYMQNLLETKTDPLAIGTSWALEIPYIYFALINLGVFITVLVLMMGFMLRSAQLIKSTNPTEFVGRPGWAIWGFIIPLASYFIPYQVLASIRNFAKYDEAKSKKNTQLLIGFWVPYALSNFLSFQVFRDIVLNPSYSQLVDDGWISLLTSALGFVSSVFLILLLPALYQGIQKRMSERVPAQIAATS